MGVLLRLATVLGGNFQMEEMRCLWAALGSCGEDELREAMGLALAEHVLDSRGSSGYRAANPLLHLLVYIKGREGNPPCK